MEETTKGIIAFVTVVILVFTGFIWMMKQNEKKEEGNRQKEQQEIQECYDKTSDLNYCLDIFNK